MIDLDLASTHQRPRTGGVETRTEAATGGATNADEDVGQRDESEKVRKIRKGREP